MDYTQFIEPLKTYMVIGFVYAVWIGILEGARGVKPGEYTFYGFGRMVTLWPMSMAVRFGGLLRKLFA